MKNKIITIILMALFVVSVVAATDVRAPRASISAVGVANSQSSAQLVLVARDIGHGNDGLSRLEVELVETGQVVHSRSIANEVIFSETISVTKMRKGTNTYKLKVWDLAGNYDDDTVKVDFVNNKPSISLNYPALDVYETGIVPINFTLTDIDNETVKVGAVMYSCGHLGDLEVITNLQNDPNYAFTNTENGVDVVYDWNTSQSLQEGEDCYVRVSIFDSESIVGGNSEEFKISNVQPQITLEDVSPWNINTGTVQIEFNTTKEAAVTSVSVNGNSATVSGDNNTNFVYTYDVTAADPDGDAEIIIAMTDLYGLNATFRDASFLFVDQTGPTIENEGVQDGEIISDNQTTLDVEIEDAGVGVNESTLLITVNGPTFSQTYSVDDQEIVWDGDAQATLDPTEAVSLSSLPDGRYNISVLVDDNLGIGSTDNWYFIVDTTAPNITISYPQDEDILNSGNVPVNVTVSDVNGLDEVWVMNGNNKFNTTLNGGVYQTTVPFTTNGVKNLVAYANDTAGNLASDAISITVDRDMEAPVINNTQPTATNDNTPTITANVYDDGSGVNASSIVLAVGGSSYTTTDSELNFTSDTLTFIPGSSLGDGVTAVKINASDNEGNEAYKTWNIEIDSTDPVVAITSPTNGSITGTDVTVQFTITEDNLDYVQVRTNTGNWMNISGSTANLFTSLTKDVVNELQVRAFDEAGNSGTDSVFVNSSQDNSLPEISFVYPVEGQRIKTNVFNVSVNATDNVAIVAVNVNDGTNTTVMSNGGSGDIYMAELNLTDGNYLLRAFANDTSGNNATTSVNINVNTNITYGVLTGQVTDNNNVGIFNALVSGYLGDELINSTTTSADGSYSMILEEGFYTINVTAPSHQTTSTTETVGSVIAIKNVQLLPVEDVSVDLVNVVGSLVEKQTLTVQANLSKRLSATQTVNATLSVDSTPVESKQLVLGQSGSVSFDIIAQEGLKTLKVSVMPLSGEQNTVNNEKTTQITSDAIEDAVSLNIFAPPYNLAGNTQYNIPVIVVNKGDKALQDVQINVTAQTGITVNGDEMKTIDLPLGNSTTLTWLVTTGTVDAGVGENTITSTAYNLVNSTDTLRSAVGQGFS